MIFEPSEPRVFNDSEWLEIKEELFGDPMRLDVMENAKIDLARASRLRDMIFRVPENHIYNDTGTVVYFKYGGTGDIYSMSVSDMKKFRLLAEWFELVIYL